MGARGRILETFKARMRQDFENKEGWPCGLLCKQALVGDFRKSFASGAEARGYFGTFAARLNSLLKKSEARAKCSEKNIPQRLKPGHFAGLIGTDKSVPFQSEPLD
jgi:hypothetical protein